MEKRKYIGKKQKGNVKYLLFGKYRKRPINTVPHSYLYWVLENFDLSVWEKSVIDAILTSKTERLIQKEILKELDWLKQ